MRLWFPHHRSVLALLTGLALPPALALPVQGQQLTCRPPICCPAPCPYPTPPRAPLPGEQPLPQPGPGEQRPPTPPASPPAVPPVEPTLNTEQASATETSTFAAPNLVGHLLLASRSVTFRYNRAAGAINVANNGSTSLVNPSVADDNSPLPLDRVGFRYNHFGSAQQVTGFGPGVFEVQGVGTSFAQGRKYDLDGFTFNVEKTFLDQMASVELRVPFSTGLSPNLDLSAGDVTGPVLGPNGQPMTSPTGPVFGVRPTPERTLGSEGTQFGNMTLIFKGLLYSSRPLSLSGGVAVGIPSGDNSSVNIIDYSGSTTMAVATIQRLREIHVDNEAWSLSPFVAFLSTPTDRFFTQGFVQFDFPLNTDTINYTESILRGTVAPVLAAPARFPTLFPPFSYRTGISEQPLMQMDLGVGYWVLKDESRRWLTGIAPSLELHYTTTLRDAPVATLPADNFLQLNQATNRLSQEQPPQVGNQRNRMDILDMTVASTFVLCDRATLATGVSFPLKGHEDRTFDWEFHLQLNYYFGARGRRVAPNF